MILKTSPAGIGFITFMEGRRSVPYRDSKGLWTCGVGHLMHEGEDLDTPWSDEKIAHILATDLAVGEAAVNSVGVPLSQMQFDALVSLVHNIGPHAFTDSAVVRDLRKLRYLQAADGIMEWNSHGLLTARRCAERGVFIYGTAP